MNTPWKRSIRLKLTAMIMLISTTTALLACLGFVLSDLHSLRNDLAHDLSTLSDVVASSSTAALAFGDRASAQEVLHALRAKPSIISACIYTKAGQPFASYEPNGVVKPPARLRPDGLYERFDRVELFRSIRLDHERVGTLYIASDARDRNARLEQYGMIVATIVLGSLLIAFVLSSWLQRSVSGPIVELSRVASLVKRDKSFGMRAIPPGLSHGDEIGNLVAGFNSMLAEIEQRDARLRLQQSALEDMVILRTGELTAANEELLEAKNSAERIAEINARLARESALILNCATDGILGLDLDNRPTFLNPAAMGMIGMTLCDFKGRSIHEAVHHSYPDGTPWPEEDCAATEAVRRGEPVHLASDTFWRSDGTSFPVEYASTPMFDEAGKHLGAVVIFRDVTERRAVERLKSEFVSTVSHELRTPLTSIRGALGLLSGGLLGPIAEKGRRMLEIAVTNTDRLVRLINDILDLERIESGTVELVRGHVNPMAVMVQAAEGLQSMADQAGVRVDILPATGTVFVDSDRIMQTLTNLLGNAIKFSPPDTTVTLSAVEREKDFLFSVADQGRGVPEEKLQAIFGRFSQVDASDSRAKGGSGLGLAISQSIVQAHGGRIWAEKNEPAGSRFQFTIPFANAASALAGSPDAMSASNDDDLYPEEPVPTILIVEDDLDLAGVMGTALQHLGIHTRHAATGGDAIHQCGMLEPDLIVLDLGLPDMDGFELVESLRENELLARTPLLVYSALDVGSADQPRLRLGRTDFLTKSRCSMAEFKEHVLRLLHGDETETKETLHVA